jgi:hypothetical protein
VVITSRILTERDSHEFATSAVTSEIGEKWITEAFNWHQLEVRHQAQAQDSKASEIWRPNTRCSRSFSGTGVCMNHDCVDNDSLSFIPLHVVLWPGQPVLDCVLEWVSKYPARHMKQPVNRVILWSTTCHTSGQWSYACSMCGCDVDVTFETPAVYGGRGWGLGVAQTWKQSDSNVERSRSLWRSITSFMILCTAAEKRQELMHGVDSKVHPWGNIHSAPLEMKTDKGYLKSSTQQLASLHLSPTKLQLHRHSHERSQKNPHRICKPNRTNLELAFLAHPLEVIHPRVYRRRLGWLVVDMIERVDAVKRCEIFFCSCFGLDEWDLLCQSTTDTL